MLVCERIYMTHEEILKEFDGLKFPDRASFEASYNALKMKNTQEEQAKEAFIKRGFWPNEVMWACWLDAWKQSAQKERDGLVRIIEANILDEREACASACETMGPDEFTAQNCAEIIRERNK